MSEKGWASCPVPHMIQNFGALEGKSPQGFSSA